MVDLPEPLRRALAAVRSVGAITGAGVSHESGIRTYRGRGGLYDDPEEGERTVEALSGSTFRTDPARTWRVIRDLLEQAWGARPNAGHLALARMEERVERFTLLTQNVDGLHAAAGSRNVIAIHGDVRRLRCEACGAKRTVASPDELDPAPVCPSCGEALRPDVVLFGELLPFDELARLRRAFYEDVPDLVLLAGTTAVFPYIAEPVLLARAMGKLTVEVNPEPTELSDAVDWSLRGTAGALLPALADALAAGR
jgi:NAD-dependent deacetylase